MDTLTIRPRVSDLVYRFFAEPVTLPGDEIAALREIRWNGQLLSIRLTATGHAIEWREGNVQFTEIITTLDTLLPGQPRLSHVFQGERRGRVRMGNIRYEVGLQLELMSAEVFTHVHDDLAASGGRGFLHQFAPHHRIGLTPLAFVTVEVIPTGLAIATFHTFPGELALVKTQSLIETNHV
ncbi:hypothetical protein BH11PLA2_BH11PLA2_03990 [soil metagenome]